MSAALAIVDGTGEFWCAAELHRIEGELVIMQSGRRRPPLDASSKAAVGGGIAGRGLFQASACDRRSAAGAVVGIEGHARAWGASITGRASAKRRVELSKTRSNGSKRVTILKT